MDILLVEDNPGDVRLMKLVFQEVFPSVHLHVANDGLEALVFLRRFGPNAKAARPADLIMLDLNMPKMDGRELLAEIKKDARLKVIPVVIFTTSGAEEDVLAGYALQASSYLRKPVDFDALKKRIQTIGDYWLNVTLPGQPALQALDEPVVERPRRQSL
jgi:chemotaxis family two-component system response regulator Rcp1